MFVRRHPLLDVHAMQMKQIAVVLGKSTMTGDGHFKNYYL